MIKITDVNYIDLENKMTEVKDVHIPSNINKEIDGRNKYILPGLVDMHTHITPNSAKHYLHSGVTSVRILVVIMNSLSILIAFHLEYTQPIDLLMENLGYGDQVHMETFLLMILKQL